MGDSRQTAGSNLTMDEDLSYLKKIPHFPTQTPSEAKFQAFVQCVRVCVCLCSIDFYFHFLSGTYKGIWEVYTPLPLKKLTLLCHQFCEVTVVDAEPYASVAFYKSCTRGSA